MPMNFPVNNIIGQYFNKPSLEETAVEDIERLVDEYPYHTVARFLLAKKYRQLQHAGFNGQAAKATLYFNNPYWLNLLLRDEPVEEVSGTSENPVTTGHPVEETGITAETPTGSSAKSAADDLIATLQANLRAAAGQQEPAEQVVQENTPTPVTAPVAEETDVPEPVSDTAEITLAAQPIGIPEEQSSISTAETDISEDIVAPTDITIPAETATPPEELPVAEPLAEPVVEATAIAEPTPATAEITIVEETGTVPEEHIATIEQPEELPAAPITEPVTEEAWLYTDEGRDADEDAIDNTPEAPTETTGTLEGKTKLSDIWRQPVDPNEDLIPVEPLHTVDYFASQGIKLSQIENEGQDKLSLKLKSFTEWLKTMKRIHPEKLETSPEQVQTVIQHIAENSNKHKEVLTEAIAEVFAKQGLKHKAIDVYKKLSLQDPDKSAYFAAKISKLNES